MLLALVASLVTAFAVSFGAGQLVNDKMRLVNAADAAAYSAAQWEARSLNFQSYLNRAIVANEVAIAQLVSLRAWSSYVATLTHNGAAVARWIPPLAGPVQSLERAWQAVDSSLQAAAPGLAAAYLGDVGSGHAGISVSGDADSAGKVPAGKVSAGAVASGIGWSLRLKLCQLVFAAVSGTPQ